LKQQPNNYYQIDFKNTILDLEPENKFSQQSSFTTFQKYYIRFRAG